MPPKKTTKKNKKIDEPKFIILKNINPIKLIYEHILSKGLNKQDDIIVMESDDPNYIDHIIQDVEVTNSATDILKHQSSMAYTLFTDIRKNNIKSWPILISDDESKDSPKESHKSDHKNDSLKEPNLFNKKSFDYNKLTKIKCWWCKNSFDTLPLGCPIRKDENKILMEGVMCSFPCVKTYIKNIGCEGIRYKDSMSILNYLYDIFKENSSFSKSDIFKENNKIDNELIPDAPHWNLLKEFGGHLSIEEFRSTFGKIKYTKTSNILLVSYPLLYTERYIATSPQKR